MWREVDQLLVPDALEVVADAVGLVDLRHAHRARAVVVEPRVHLERLLERDLAQPAHPLHKLLLAEVAALVGVERAHRLEQRVDVLREQLEHHRRQLEQLGLPLLAGTVADVVDRRLPLHRGPLPRCHRHRQALTSVVEVRPEVAGVAPLLRCGGARETHSKTSAHAQPPSPFSAASSHLPGGWWMASRGGVLLQRRRVLRSGRPPAAAAGRVRGQPRSSRPAATAWHSRARGEASSCTVARTERAFFPPSPAGQNPESGPGPGVGLASRLQRAKIWPVAPLDCAAAQTKGALPS